MSATDFFRDIAQIIVSESSLFIKTLVDDTSQRIHQIIDDTEHMDDFSIVMTRCIAHCHILFYAFLDFLLWDSIISKDVLGFFGIIIWILLQKLTGIVFTVAITFSCYVSNAILEPEYSDMYGNGASDGVLEIATNLQPIIVDVVSIIAYFRLRHLIMENIYTGCDKYQELCDVLYRLWFELCDGLEEHMREVGEAIFFYFMRYQYEMAMNARPAFHYRVVRYLLRWHFAVINFWEWILGFVGLSDNIVYRLPHALFEENQ